MDKIRHIARLLAVALTMTSCSDVIGIPDDIGSGDAITFTTLMPEIKQATRTAKEKWQEEISAYNAVNQGYTFNIEMWKHGEDHATGNSNYKPISEDVEGVLTYSADGTLTNIAAPLYWQDNVSRWGFRATAGTEELEADQSDQQKWLAQDRLLGYSYLPIWEGEDDGGRPVDDIKAINYRTNREWYRDNQTALKLSGLMVQSPEDYKKVPLYLQHQRSWVTVILKAGEGVTREALAYATSGENIHTTIYSHKTGESKALAIQAWSSEKLIDYDSDKNGDARTDVSTTRYDAIVEPHNFIETREKEERDTIARINVSNQKFTFTAANDINYASYIADGGTEEAKRAMQVYNLQPGKHLTITATLSRASRMIMITAWIEDWTETVTQTICDDYGQNGDPILINNRKELLQFLMDPDKNKAGNVGMIVPNALDLDTVGHVWPREIADSLQNVTLKATLNLAGCILTTSKQFVKEIARTGSIINGEINVTDGFSAPSAIADVNYGMVERVRVTTSGELTPARASKAGLIDMNYGTIYQCSSALPVYGTTTGYVGGIAAQSLFNGNDGVSPVIDACTVTARVDGNADVTAGGGIVGVAEGRVSYNTFEYGITLLQDHKFYNIIAAIGSDKGGLTNHENNAWPTTASYNVESSQVTITNSNAGTHYYAVIDNQEELKTVMTSAYNHAGRTYCLANSFSVEKEKWIWGSYVLNNDYFATNSGGEYANGTLKFTLNGNNKTITLTGATNATMLFGSIIGEVYDLNLMLEKPIVAARIMDNQNHDDSNTDAIAAFAYAITTSGDAKGIARNITLKADASGVYIESSTPGGIAVWASHGGELINCASNVPIRMHLTTMGTDARHYAGGIVACAQKASITQCKYYGSQISWTEGDDADKAKKSNCRYGGIVGGTSEIAGTHDEQPSLVLSDCYSWWDLPTFGENVDSRPVMGSLIGSTVYHQNEEVKNAMAPGNAGNWWSGTVGAQYLASGVTEEKAIGRKNSVVPTIPQGW